LGILGALVVIGVIVVLLLGFAVGPKWFAGDDNGDGGGGGKAAGNPEQTVENFYNAFEKQDIDMFIATMEPDFVEEMEDALGDEYADQLEENLFSGMPEDIDFEIEEMESEVTGDTAEVTIIAGTMSYTEDGEEITEDIEDSDMADFTFELVEVDGKWYLSEDTLVEMGFDYSDLESDGDGDYDSDGDYDPGDLVDLPVDSEDEVVTLLLEETEIWDWYMETDYPDYDISEESDVYEVYLFELDEDDNEIPFAYYAVDKETGEVYEITR
jgi:ketosteroid isomerase-like protein